MSPPIVKEETKKDKPQKDQRSKNLNQDGKGIIKYYRVPKYSKNTLPRFLWFLLQMELMVSKVLVFSLETKVLR